MNKKSIPFAPRLKDAAKRDNYTFWLLGILVVVLILFPALKGQNIWTGSTIKSMAMQFPEYGVMALGLMLCFISGGIDMSFVSIANFTAIIAVKIMNSDAGQANVIPMIALAAVVAIAIGAVAGFLNGLFITGFGIPPILATLATMQVYSGLSKVLTQGKSQSVLDSTYSEIGHSSLFGFLPMPLFVFLICFVMVAFLLSKTVYGENLYMMGSNTKAAHYSAMNTTKMTHLTFMISGILAAVGGLLMTSTYNSAKPDYGSSYAMQCILISVLAGVSTFGGKGRIQNLLLSVVIVQIISSGVNNFPNINTYYRSLIWGALLLFMMINNYLQESDRGFGKYISKIKRNRARAKLGGEKQ